MDILSKSAPAKPVEAHIFAASNAVAKPPSPATTA
jgi:hypothetical protein